MTDILTLRPSHHTLSLNYPFAMFITLHLPLYSSSITSSFCVISLYVSLHSLLISLPSTAPLAYTIYSYFSLFTTPSSRPRPPQTPLSAPTLYTPNVLYNAGHRVYAYACLYARDRIMIVSRSYRDRIVIVS